MECASSVSCIVTLEERPWFLHQFAPMFNAGTFLAFLKENVRRVRRRKVFLIIDKRALPQP